MTAWWVNHRQTFKEEIDGGYIWSPKKNKDGSRNQTYLNLTVASIGDRIFSYAGGHIRAVGIVERKYVESERPEAFGRAGEQWDESGWLVQIRWILLGRPFSPKNHLSLISPLLPAKYSPIQVNGDGNQKCYLASISDDLANVLSSWAQSQDDGANDLISDLHDTVLADVAEDEIKRLRIPETERDQLIKARRGQGIFRLNLEKIEKACRLTEISDKRFLIASHIKPWRNSSAKEKLDGNNGLLLSPHIDKLFDRGWISFSAEGQILCANDLAQRVMTAWGIDFKKNVGQFNEQQKTYLDFHRREVFR